MTMLSDVDLPDVETPKAPYPAVDEVLAEARRVMIDRGGTTITRADVRRAEALTGQHLEM